MTLERVLGTRRIEALREKARYTTAYGLPVGDLSRDDLLALVGLQLEMGADATARHAREVDMLCGLARVTR